MRVCVKSDRNIRVAKPLRYDLRMDSSLESEGGVSVAQIVEANVGQGRSLLIGVFGSWVFDSFCLLLFRGQCLSSWCAGAEDRREVPHF